MDHPSIEKIKNQPRKITEGSTPAPTLGPLADLLGVWKSNGLGWNMIALPFAGGEFNYRLLVNQYNETLTFERVDDKVPNRGIQGSSQTDQLVATVDYVQKIAQVAAEDFPDSGGLPGLPEADIHHEPGLWLHMLNQKTNDLDIARLASIPHGDSVLALGKSASKEGPPDIPDTNGLPIGVDQNLSNPYLAPYDHFDKHPFKGNVGAASFPGFNPVRPNELLKLANQGINIVKTTKLEVDSTIETGGIVNIPFIVKQANAASMNSTFWIQHLDDGTMRLQYTQVVMLDFFARRDGMPGLIGWPHVSINTLTKVTRPNSN